MFIRASLLLIFCVVTIAAGLYATRHSKGVDGFVLGGRNIGPWLSAFAYGTSYFSAVVFVGYAGQFGFRFGISALWIGLGNAFLGSFLAWAVLARRTRVMSRHLAASTMPAFFGERYFSPTLRAVSALIAFVFLMPYAASLYNGLSRLFAMAFSVDYSYCIAAIAILTGIYVVAGGYTATAINDFIQGIIMLLGIVAVIAAVLRTHGGFFPSVQALASVEGPFPGAFASITGPEPLNLLGVAVLTSLGAWGLPQMVQKFYSVKSEKNIATGTVISTAFALVVAGGCYLLGGFARLFSDEGFVSAKGYDAIIPEMLSGLSPFLSGVVLVLVFAASLSTLSSLALTAASSLTLDILARRVGMSEKAKMLSIRSLVVVFVAISASIAILQYKAAASFIAQLMGISWGALAGAFLAPLLYGLYWKKATPVSVACNFAFSSVFMLSNMLFRPSFPTALQSPINAGAFVMLAGLAIVPLVSALTQKGLDKPKVDMVFSCYEVEGPAKARDYLEPPEE